MKYYQHKLTQEVIGVIDNLMDLIDESTNVKSITYVIIPDKVLGNGILCHCMSYNTIRVAYNRISKTKALEICQDFGQWRHVDDAYNKSVSYFWHLYLQKLLPMRKKPFGTAYTEFGEKRIESLYNTTQ